MNIFGFLKRKKTEKKIENRNRRIRTRFPKPTVYNYRVNLVKV
jgi:hypothetical protein